MRFILGVPFEDREMRKKRQKEENDETEFIHLLPQQSHKKRRTRTTFNLPFVFRQPKNEEEEETKLKKGQKG